MARTRTEFLCNSCGSVHPKWLGKCPDCGAWNSLEEYRAAPIDPHKPSAGADTQAPEPLNINEIDHEDAVRLVSGLGEFDRILGGGIVPGSAILVGGEPGIGKSTLLLQVADALASHAGAKRSAAPDSSHPILYVTSEESARQTSLRASRLELSSDNLLVLAETNLERIVHQINKVKPGVVIVDSIQMIYKPQVPAAPGSVTQLRDCCMELVYLAKSTATAVIFVGHVTKAGTLAGPKIIEHIVDTVLYFEGDRFHSHRIVRCVKNRFGSTHEVGLFEMTGEGLREVTDPSRLFMEHYGGVQPSGSVLTAAMHGSRVLVLEVQALTASSVIGATRRKVSGVSSDRVAMIIAVLEKRCELRLAADDVFVNVVGGVKVAEPAIDLAVALAIASAHTNRALAPGTLAVGELGLGGEVRAVNQLELRLREAARLGLSRALVPHLGKHQPNVNGLHLEQVRWLNQALSEM